MKSAAIVILFPLMSVLVVSLYVLGGTSRTAALILLVLSSIGALVGLLIRSRSTGNG